MAENYRRNDFGLQRNPGRVDGQNNGARGAVDSQRSVQKR